MKQCIQCGGPREVGRKICAECHRKDNRLRSKLRYETIGRTWYYPFCLACKNSFKSSRKDAPLCPSCRKESKINNGKNQYVYDSANYKKNIFEHRNIAERVLNRKLNSNEIVHHIDGDPKNNSLENLIILSRSKHTSLHSFLDLQRVIISKGMNEKPENCWKTLIVPMTTTWLETANVKVIKLSEIGQSAAESL